MFRRILRSMIVFGVLVAAYQAYARWAVPHMEPSLALREKRLKSKDELEVISKAPSKSQLLLSNYFPKDHWSQIRTPKVIANATEQSMLVFDEFTRRPGTTDNPDGSKSTLVDIKQIALLIFPTPPREGIPPPRDAIIVEAPQGAHLEFDDFRPEAGHIGQIIRGEFPGPIRIHSDMRQPGPEDDLLVETSDVQMNTKLMYTSAPVRFRMGPNVGSGRELEIRFLADEHSKPTDQGLKIAGIDSLEIRREFQMRAQFDTSSMLPGGKDASSKASQDKSNPPPTVNPSVQVTDVSAVPPVPAAPPKPPVDITCTGPFTFDFVRYVASFDRDVEVRQLNPIGPSDQLSCTRMDVQFAPKPQLNAAVQPVVVDPGKRQQHDLGQLEAVTVVAEGHPVVATSPARNAQAKGDRIQFAIHEQRVRISGGTESVLVSGTSVLRAPIIDYQQPAHDETTALGRFRATGPGTLHYASDPTKPQQVLDAEWQTSVQLGREKGQPVLVLEGRPKVAFGAAGSLTADQIRMYLRELEGQGTAGMALGGIGATNGKNAATGGDAQSKVRLAPDRLAANGRVIMVSPQFTGATHQLLAAFRLQPDAPAASAETPAASGAAPGKADGGKATSETNGAPGAAGPPQPTYHIDADQMRLDVYLKGQTAVPATLNCDGNILLREMTQTPANQQPLEIRGGQLMVTQLDTKLPHVTLAGVAPGQAPGSALAQVAGRGVTMVTDLVELDERENRMWSNGPGKATLLVAQNMQGNASATPVPMDLHWQGGLRFDGRTIYFDRDVIVTGMDGTLRCDQLAAKLAAPIQFGQKVDQANVSLSEIECRGQVTVDRVSRDPVGGVASHERMQLARLVVNQQTGAISGDGPGVVRSTRYGNGLVAVPGQPGAQSQAAPAPPANAAGSKLYFLRVDFHSGLDGNFYLRELTFHEHVRTVYGPVDSWEQELDLTRPETLPPDSTLLSCDHLRLNEDAVAARAAATPNNGTKRPLGPVQMQAQGDVRMEGQVPGQGEFRVQADRASYDKSKETFVLEGDTRTPARLWRRNAAGVDAPPFEAQKIRYFRLTNTAQVMNFQFMEITPSDIQSARRPTPVK